MCDCCLSFYVDCPGLPNMQFTWDSYTPDVRCEAREMARTSEDALTTASVVLVRFDSLKRQTIDLAMRRLKHTGPSAWIYLCAAALRATLSQVALRSKDEVPALH